MLPLTYHYNQFFWLSIVSPVADLFVLLIEILSIPVGWLNIFAIILTFVEVVIKVSPLRVTSD